MPPRKILSNTNRDRKNFAALPRRTGTKFVATLVLAVIVVGFLGSLPQANAFSEVSTLTANSSEDRFYAAVIDAGNGFAYFGTFATPGKIVKVRLSDFTEVATLTLNRDPLYTAVIDVGNGFAYFGTLSFPTKVVKVRLSDFKEIATLTLDLTINGLTSAVIDTGNGFAYFGTAASTSPGKVVKVRLSDFTEVATLTLNPDEYDLVSAVIDTESGFAYFGTCTYPGKVVKVRLSDFKEVPTLTLNSDEACLFSAVVDVGNGFAYFGTSPYPGKVVKVHLSDFKEVATLTLKSGQYSLQSAVIDVGNGFAYFGTGTSPGKIVKVRLSDLAEVATLTLNSGEDLLFSAVIDAGKGFAYFGTNTVPGKVVKIAVAGGIEFTGKVASFALSDPSLVSFEIRVDNRKFVLDFALPPDQHTVTAGDVPSTNKNIVYRPVGFMITDTAGNSYGVLGKETKIGADIRKVEVVYREFIDARASAYAVAPRDADIFGGDRLAWQFGGWGVAMQGTGWDSEREVYVQYDASSSRQNGAGPQPGEDICNRVRNDPILSRTLFVCINDLTRDARQWYTGQGSDPRRNGHAYGGIAIAHPDRAVFNDVATVTGASRRVLVPEQSIATFHPDWLPYDRVPPVEGCYFLPSTGASHRFSVDDRGVDQPANVPFSQRRDIDIYKRSFADARSFGVIGTHLYPGFRAGSCGPEDLLPPITGLSPSTSNAYPSSFDVAQTRVLVLAGTLQSERRAGPKGPFSTWCADAGK